MYACGLKSYLSVGVTDILAAVLVGEVQRVPGELRRSSLLALDQEGVVVACFIHRIPKSVFLCQSIFSHLYGPNLSLLLQCNAIMGERVNVRVTAQIRSELRGFCAMDILALCVSVNSTARSGRGRLRRWFRFQCGMTGGAEVPRLPCPLMPNFKVLERGEYSLTRPLLAAFTTRHTISNNNNNTSHNGLDAIIRREQGPSLLLRPSTHTSADTDQEPQERIARVIDLSRVAIH